MNAHPRRHAHKTPKKKGVISESCHDLLLASLSLKAWRTGFKGLGGCLLYPFVNTQANPLPISTHRGMKQSCSDFMIFKILKDIIFQQNGWGRMPWPQFKVGWKANIRVALNTGWRDDPGSHTSGRRKLHGLEAACWVIGDIGEQQAPNGSQLFNLGISNIVRDSEMGMDQYLLIPFLVGWTSIYQLFWCSPGVQGFDTLPDIQSQSLQEMLQPATGLPPLSTPRGC